MVYLALLTTQTQIYLSYRLSFVLWRLRNVLNFIVIYFLWSAVFTHKAALFSYSREKMLTYILFVGVMNAIILATRTTDVAADIVNGNIIHQLLRPISFFSVVITRELVDKIINCFFAIFEVGIFILLLKPPLFIQTQPDAYLFLAVALLVGAIISFFVSFSLSLVAFWTSEVWAPRFIYFILISVLAGTAFPLDILPQTVYNILLFTPFPYLIYVPIKIYLEGVNATTMPLLLSGLAWCGILFALTRIVWRKGIKEFSFYGK